MASSKHTVWVVMREYDNGASSEPEAAFFSRIDLVKWVEASGGWDHRYYCGVDIPEICFPARSAVAS